MNRSSAAEVWANIILFLIGLAGFVGLFLSWPFGLCVILLLIGWGVLILTNTDGSFDF